MTATKHPATIEVLYSEGSLGDWGEHVTKAAAEYEIRLEAALKAVYPDAEITIRQDTNDKITAIPAVDTPDDYTSEWMATQEEMEGRVALISNRVFEEVCENLDVDAE